MQTIIGNIRCLGFLVGILFATHTYAQGSTLLISEPQLLSQWEAQSLAFTKMVGTEQELELVYKEIQSAIEQIKRLDPQAGIGIQKYNHRLFNTRWLNSRQHHFELIGVVNRNDRYAFYTPKRACGETRLIYRLTYPQSRLPMTVSLELRADAAQDLSSCQTIWKQWHRAPAQLMTEAGPLHQSRLQKSRIEQLAINFQSVRWPATIRPDMGGHAEYTLLAFRWDDRAQKFTPKKLENTPDIKKIKQYPALKEKLLNWLLQPEQIQTLDKGYIQIPEEYLAQKAQSSAPGGLARLSNRPYTTLFADATSMQRITHTKDLNAQRDTVRSAQAWLRRLDDMTCMGCHQSRAAAGFHFLGEDKPHTFAGNRLAQAISPHFKQELERRSTPLVPRPFAENGRQDGQFGDVCGLGDAGFAHWSCAKGLQCTPHGTQGVGATGVCMPVQSEVGSLCEPAYFTQNSDASKDRAIALKNRTGATECAGTNSVCEATRVGFPGGMCSGQCAPNSPNGLCGAIAVLTPFNACLAKNLPFAQCLTQNTRPANLRACNLEQPCRDDYICAEHKPGAKMGVCIPPYFLFQMRVDGHP